MKKILITMLSGLLISLATFAQNYTVTVYGTVMTVVNNTVTPVADQAVTISVDSLMNGNSYLNTVYTDETGYYEDIAELQGYSGYAFVQAMTFDSCQGQNLYNYQPVLPGQTLQPMDFYLCNYITPDCQSMFYYYQLDPIDPNTYSFMNSSTGNYTEVTWNFGDSTYSNELNPIHTFPGEGTYYVCLTISDGADCNSSYCEFVTVGGNGWNGCENYFLYNYANNDPYTLNFEGYLYNGMQALSYSWDFGDGTTGSGQTVTHTYAPQGLAIYMVALTTMALDSSGMDTCVYTSIQEVWIQNQFGCNAYFTYYPDSTNQLTINFLDMSYDANGMPPDSWYWEFGDGTNSTLQNPVHTYADSGFYMVCLTITTDSGSCTSSYCEEVFTGYTPPPSDCESFIMLNNIYGLTVDFQGYTISQYPTDFMWEFGDGTTGTGEYISHTYSSPGIYNVYLNTLDATGCAYQTLTQVWLDSTFQGCSNYFTYDLTDSTTFTFYGFIFQNNGMTFPDSLSTYSWDFGDGTSGTGQTITHYFQENPYGYNVCLTATTILPDGSVCTALYCEFIQTAIPSLNIYGYVYLDNNMVADQAVVNLMSMDSLWQGVIEIGSTTIDSGGFYSFPEIPMDNGRLYFTQAELTEGSAYFGEYLPTYHLSAMSWEQAVPILPLENWPAEIFMIPGSPVEGGSGTITGVVTELGSRGFMNDVEVVLMDSESSPLQYVRSDDQGYFSFENLPYNTYIIHAEIMGIQTNQAEISLSEENPVSSVEVLVSSTEANVVFGMREHQVNLDKVGDVFPNPVIDNARVEITVKKAVDLQVSIISQTGQVVNINAMSLPEGTHNYEIETESLPIGLYLLRISTDQGEVVSRKFMRVN